MDDLLDLQSRAIEHGVHAIRSLLLAGNYAALLLEERAGPLTPAQKDCLRTVILQTRQIKDVLASLSRVAECRELQVTRFPLSKLVEEVMLSEDMMQHLSSGERDWEWTVDAKCEVCILADWQKLREGMLAFLREYPWSGRLVIGIGVQNRCVDLTFCGSFAPRSEPMADEVQEVSRMRTLETMASPEPFRCPDAVRLHGGSASARTLDDGRHLFLIQIPAASEHTLPGQPETDGLSNA